MQHIYTYTISVMNAIIHPNIHIRNSVHRLQQAVPHSYIYNHNYTVLYALARSMKYRYQAMGWKGIHG